MFLPVCVLWIEIASKSSCLHLASLLSDQLTSKVLRLNVCISEVCCGDFCGDHCQVFIVFYSLCSSVVPPPLFFILCRKGQQLEPSEQYIFNRLEGGRSMLTIRNIRQGDGGTYTCKATNKAGSQERELFLKVFGKDDVDHWNKGNRFVLLLSFRLETGGLQSSL